jgi:hypothetical protein
MQLIPRVILVVALLWNDLTGGGNNGTLVNGVGYTSDNGGAMVFDGVDDFMTIEVNNTDISLGSSDFTLCVWYKNNSNNRYHHLYNVQNQSMFAWKANNTEIGEVYFYGGNDYRSFTSDFNGWSLDFGIWNHHTLVREGLYFRGYKNGIYMGTYETTFKKDITGSPIFLGSNGLTTGERAQHDRNIQMVYNRALTPVEIQQTFNATRGRFGL